MTIVEIIEKLSQERSFGSRFPVRIIFTESLKAYSALVSNLKSVCDVTINIADFGKVDVAPQFDKMKATLSTYVDKQVLILSAGEYLRICTKRELDNNRRQFRAFWEQMQPEASKMRYVLPVFCCRDIFDRVVGTVDERQQDFAWTLDYSADAESHTIAVYSPKFKTTISADADDLESWLKDWPIILSLNRPCTVVSNQYRNVELSCGTVNIKAIDSPFTYLANNLLDGNALVQMWQDDNFWARLIPYASKDEKFSKVVLDALNIKTFEFVSVVARWKTLNDLQRNLIWLWYRVYPTDEYFSYACKKATQADEIPARIRDEILLISKRSQNWMTERMDTMRALSFLSFDDSYFVLLDKLPLAETKLQLLTYQTHEECVFAIKVVSGLLRDGVESTAIAEMIQDCYQALATYMSECIGIDATIDEYLAWYRKNKLINRFPGDYPAEISFDKFDARFKLLHKMQDKDCFTLWIDGFGVEWVPVFLQELKIHGIAPESLRIASAILPTETEYNHQWDENDSMSDKWDRLDSFSHKGIPDDKSYYSCIVHQLSVFTDVAKRVDELLEEHEYVVVTGDHGSSRLAALAFHDSGVVPIAAPPKAIVRSFGRFCELDDNADNFIALQGMTKSTLNNKTYVMMNNYQHFSVGGNAAGGNTDDHDVVGEIHGGNTPEERLVPVIIMKRKQPLPALICKPASKYVEKKEGCIQTNLSFSRPVSSVEVSLGSNVASCSANTDGTWHVSIGGVSSDELSLSVVANGCLLADKVPLKVKSQGITKSNDPFGGMGL